MRRYLRALATLAGVAALSACASTPTTSVNRDEALVADPFEPFNRAIFQFNDDMDQLVISRVSAAYGAVVPRFGRDRIRDFVDNLKTPVWFANEVLQGDLEGARDQASRFVLNTTVGVGGLYDFAGNVVGIEKHDEDFGQTLAVWGVGNGPFLMLPLMGPSTTRDLAGRVGDYALSPFTWTDFEGEDTLRRTSLALDIIDIRHRTDGAIELIRESVDPYVQTRTFYIQARNRRILEQDYEDLPDFE